MAMRPKGTLLPILHEADWSGAAHAVSRPLVLHEPETSYVPIVAYAYDQGERRLVLTALGFADEERELAEVEAEAAKNVLRRLPDWKEQWANAIAIVDEYASSALVSAPMLDAACERLGSETILLVAPTRGLLVATARPADGDANLGRYASQAFAAAFDTRLTPRVLSWTRGGPLTLFRLELPEPGASVFDVRDYDEDEEILEVALTLPLGPGIVSRLRRIVAKGSLDDGRTVASIRVVAENDAEAAVIRERIGSPDVDVVVRSIDRGGER